MPSYEDEVGAELEEPEYDELDAEQYALSQYLAESEARQAIERGVAELQEKNATDETSRRCYSTGSTVVTVMHG
jgi:hypothetical protein